MGLQVCRVDHHGRLLTVFRRQSGHHPREDALFTPKLPAAVERFMRAIFPRRIPPAQAIAIAIAIAEDNPTQHPSVIDPWLAVRLREERRKFAHLLIGQPEKMGWLPSFPSRRRDVPQWC